MKGKEAWSIIAPLLGNGMEKNPVTLEAYGITYLALCEYDKRFIEKVAEADALEWEADEADNARIGDRISESLQRVGMSQRELADKCKITEVSMSRYVRNERIPKATTIREIAKALNVTTDYLIYGY